MRSETWVRSLRVVGNWILVVWHALIVAAIVGLGDFVVVFGPGRIPGVPEPVEECLALLFFGLFVTFMILGYGVAFVLVRVRRKYGHRVGELEAAKMIVLLSLPFYGLAYYRRVVADCGTVGG